MEETQIITNGLETTIENKTVYSYNNRKEKKNLSRSIIKKKERNFTGL